MYVANLASRIRREQKIDRSEGYYHGNDEGNSWMHVGFFLLQGHV